MNHTSLTHFVSFLMQRRFLLVPTKLSAVLSAAALLMASQAYGLTLPLPGAVNYHIRAAVLYNINEGGQAGETCDYAYGSSGTCTASASPYDASSQAFASAEIGSLRARLLLGTGSADIRIQGSGIAEAAFSDRMAFFPSFGVLGNVVDVRLTTTVHSFASGQDTEALLLLGGRATLFTPIGQVHTAYDDAIWAPSPRVTIEGQWLRDQPFDFTQLLEISGNSDCLHRVRCIPTLFDVSNTVTLTIEILTPGWDYTTLSGHRYDPPSVPEPSTGLLVMTGLGSLARRRRRRG